MVSVLYATGVSQDVGAMIDFTVLATTYLCRTLYRRFEGPATTSRRLTRLVIIPVTAMTLEWNANQPDSSLVPRFTTVERENKTRILVTWWRRGVREVLNVGREFQDFAIRFQLRKSLIELIDLKWVGRILLKCVDHSFWVVYIENIQMRSLALHLLRSPKMLINW